MSKHSKGHLLQFIQLCELFFGVDFFRVVIRRGGWMEENHIGPVVSEILSYTQKDSEIIVLLLKF